MKLASLIERTIAPVISCVLLSGFVCSCALPPTQKIDYGIPTEELRVVGITREATNDLQKSHFKSAELGFRQALALDSGNRALSINLARTLVSSGQIDEAQTLLRSLLRKFPKDPELLFLQLRIYQAKKEYAQALALLDMQLELLAQAEDERLSGKVSEEERGTEKQLRHSLLTELRDFSARIGELERAVCVASLLVLIDPSADTLAAYLKLVLTLGSVDAVRVVVEDSDASFPFLDDPTIQVIYAQTLLLEGNYAQAYELARLLTLRPELLPTVEPDVNRIRMLAGYFILHGTDQVKKNAIPTVADKNLFPKPLSEGAVEELREYWESAKRDQVLSAVQAEASAPQLVELVDEIFRDRDASR